MKVIIYNNRKIENGVLVSTDQNIKEPYKTKELLACLKDEAKIEIVVLSEISINKTNIDDIIYFLREIQAKLI